MFFALHCDTIMLHKLTDKHTFQINVLVPFFDVLYIFQTACDHHQEGSLYTQLLYNVFFAHLCKQSSRWKSVFDIDDKPTWFEMCRRCQISK